MCAAVYEPWISWSPASPGKKKGCGQSLAENISFLNIAEEMQVKHHDKQHKAWKCFASWHKRAGLPGISGPSCFFPNRSLITDTVHCLSAPSVSTPQSQGFHRCCFCQVTALQEERDAVRNEPSWVVPQLLHSSIPREAEMSAWAPLASPRAGWSSCAWPIINTATLRAGLRSACPPTSEPPNHAGSPPAPAENVQAHQEEMPMKIQAFDSTPASQESHRSPVCFLLAVTIPPLLPSTNHCPVSKPGSTRLDTGAFSDSTPSASGPRNSSTPSQPALLPRRASVEVIHAIIK